MDNKKVNRWQKLARWLLVALVVIIIAISAWQLIRYLSINANSFPDWTGLPEYHPPTDGVQRQQTLVDWLNLLVIPAVLAVAGLWFSYVQKQTEIETAAKAREVEREIAEKERDIDREIARDRQRQNTLDNYLDKMTELILGRGLGPDAEEEVKRIGRTRTLVVLRDLDVSRSRQVIKFLRESNLIKFSHVAEHYEGLIDKSGGVYLGGASLAEVDLSEMNLYLVNLNKVDLSGANLRGANLAETDLNEANLSKANLSHCYVHHSYLKRANLNKAKLTEAMLDWADLTEADLSGADLSGADLTDAKLSRTDLSGALYDENTKWPTDFNPVVAGAIEVAQE